MRSDIVSSFHQKGINVVPQVLCNFNFIFNRFNPIKVQRFKVIFGIGIQSTVCRDDIASQRGAWRYRRGDETLDDHNSWNLVTIVWVGLEQGREFDAWDELSVCPFQSFIYVKSNFLRKMTLSIEFQFYELHQTAPQYFICQLSSMQKEYSLEPKN